MVQTSKLSVVTVVWSYIHRMLEVVICEVDVDLLPGNHIWRENVASYRAINVDGIVIHSN